MRAFGLWIYGIRTSVKSAQSRAITAECHCAGCYGGGRNDAASEIRKDHPLLVAAGNETVVCQPSRQILMPYAFYAWLQFHARSVEFVTTSM